MSRSLMRRLRKNGSGAHVAEFGGRCGVVMGLVDYGNGVEGPELDVRWLPSKLRYAYAPWDLLPSRKKMRGAKNKEKLRDLKDRAVK